MKIDPPLCVRHGWVDGHVHVDFSFVYSLALNGVESKLGVQSGRGISKRYMDETQMRHRLNRLKQCYSLGGNSEIKHRKMKVKQLIVK